MNGLVVAAETFSIILKNLEAVLPLIFAIAIVLVIIFVVYKILTKMIYHALLSAVKRKQEVKTIMAIWRYVFIFLAFTVLVFSFSGSLAVTGLGIGLISAAFGLALQKPILGIVAWLIILIKKPFKIGDRVLVDNIKGDVSDISMFYLILSEFSGTVGSEETSGRTILIPTALLFEKPIANYTLSDPFISDEVGAEFTYKTNLHKAEKIMTEAASKFTKDYIERTGNQPSTRLFFNPSGMQAKVRYAVLATERGKVMSDITREIYEKVSAEKDVEFAYPHTEVVWGKKPLQMKGKER